MVYNYGTGWKEAPVFFVKSLGNNREHWEFSVDLGTYTSSGDPRAGYSGPGITVQFAVRYTVNGVTYWDNNGGYNKDYRMTTAEGTGTKLYAPAALGKNKIVLTYATLTDYPTTYFHGTLVVKRLSGTPAVSVVYTTNNWAQTLVLNNNYKTGSYGDLDTYYFWDYNNTSQAQYEFALSYKIGGVTYWDNNVNVNYHVSSSQREPEY